MDWVHHIGLFGSYGAPLRFGCEATDANVAGGIELMKKLNIVDSGEALTNGIGAINTARMKDFYGKMVKAGL